MLNLYYHDRADNSLQFEVKNEKLFHSNVTRTSSN